MVPPVVKTPAFGLLVAGGEVGTAGIDFGVDYSYGGIEGIFDNGGGDEGAIGGINGSDILDLLTDVDGAIVVPGTTDPGLTSYLSVEAGHADEGTLLLEVFDMDGVLITSVVNGLPLGPHQRLTMTIDRGDVYDIAFFKVSTPGADTYGVDQIDMETPVAVVIEVEIDIKPGSYPSSINLKKKGLTPVAIHTTDEFDATTVIPESVLWMPCGIAPVKWEICDCDELPNPLADPENPDYDPEAPEMIGDGDMDLVLFFDTKQLVDAGCINQCTTEATLMGMTEDGYTIEGTGDVSIVEQGKP